MDNLVGVFPPQCVLGQTRELAALVERRDPVQFECGREGEIVVVVGHGSILFVRTNTREDDWNAKNLLIGIA
jgi:hypothetical protein